MSPYLNDLRQGLRIFLRSPGLAFAAVTTLSLGIGFTTTMFSITHGGTRNLPVDDPESIVVAVMTHPARGSDNVAPGAFEFHRWRDTLTSFTDLAAYQSVGVNVSDDRARPERVSGAAVTPNALDIVGEPVLHGRRLQPADAEPGAPPVVLVSHELWQLRLGGDPSAVGESMRINGEPRVIVGVMPPRFGFPIRARLWLPLAIDRAARPDGGGLQVFGRLAPGVTVAMASAELALDMARLAAEHPATHEGRSGRAFAFIDQETPPEIRRGLYLLVVVVSIALLIACANVANLLLARAAARARDTAIRTALGATRQRLVALHLFESAALAAVATSIGLAMASVGVRFFGRASTNILDAYWMDFRIDLTVVAFAGLLGFVAAAAAGLLPALRASSVGAGSLMQQDARAGGLRIGRLGRGLMVVQLAMACGLLIITATLVTLAASLRAVDLKFPAGELLTAQLSVPSPLRDDTEARVRFARDLTTALESQPEIARAALVSHFPGRNGTALAFAWADESSAPGASPAWVDTAVVTPEFFALADAPRTRGRLFTWQDDSRAPGVAIVNESFTERFSGEREILGRRLRLNGMSFEVVGVVSSLLMHDVEDPEGAGVYLPMLQARPVAFRVLLATTGAPLDATPALRRAVEAVNPDLPLIEIRTLYDTIYADKAVLDAMAMLFFAFGVGAMGLAVIGLYAVLSFLVTTRTREFGIRMALGASPGDIVRLLLRSGARELAWGLAFGLLLALGISQAIASQMEQIPAAGAGTFVAIAALVTGTSLLAVWRPARRALRLEPVVALRVD